MGSLGAPLLPRARPGRRRRGPQVPWLRQVQAATRLAVRAGGARPRSALLRTEVSVRMGRDSWEPRPRGCLVRWAAPVRQLRCVDDQVPFYLQALEHGAPFHTMLVRISTGTGYRRGRVVLQGFEAAQPPPGTTEGRGVSGERGAGGGPPSPARRPGCFGTCLTRRQLVVSVRAGRWAVW